ncbi:MAG: hypothetical protein A3F91_12450 [Flavobacteria bacterium RIFCSPLOWO2_12_FULL_35_11]|nr:MAG: hypothetical protein A3F91_12450 [Flavobacteria bacterium RIFCSPLOWO2_12_FULL_35_11]
MKLKLSYLILLILPILSIIVNAKIYWAFIILLLVFIIVEEKVLVLTKGYYLLLYLGIPLLWMSFFSFNDHLHFIIQSLFYLTTPLIFTFVGIQLSRIVSPILLLKYIIYSGTIGAVLYILISFFNLGFYVFLNPYEMREILSWGSITNVITLIIMFFSKKNGIFFFNNFYRNLIIIINIIGLYFTASRTYYLLFIIFILIFLYKNNKKIFLLFGSLIFVLISFVLTSNFDNKLVSKIKSVVTETSMGDYDTEEDINTKYRGFETFMALKTYASGTTMNLLLGHGFEQQVDLGVEVMLGGEMRSVIPVLHNGYAYLLLKEGFLGLIFFFIFFIKVFKLKPNDNILNFNRKIIFGSIISLIVSNFVIGTFFSVEMSILWILIGAFIGHVKKKPYLETHK